MKKTCLIFLMVMSYSLIGVAQSPSPGLGAWYMVFNTNRFSEKFSFHNEAQFRFHQEASDMEQLLLRYGLNYHFSPKLMITAGYGHIETRAFGRQNKTLLANENRIWQQVILRDAIGRINLEHRYRQEQRWVNGRYSDRFRYRIYTAVPINKAKIEKGSFFGAFYDEVFLNFKQPYFDRNRLYFAVGYQLNKNAGIQLGHLTQTINSGSKNYLQLGLFINTDLRAKE